MPARDTLSTRRALLALALLLCPALAAPRWSRAAPDAADLAAALADLIAERLDLADRVAEAKWNSGQPILDPPREARVVVAFVTRAAGQGVAPGLARAFIQAQIAASRLAQEELHAAWRAAGRGPFADPPDLARDLRPRFDALGLALAAALAATAAALDRPEGRAALAGAVDRSLAGRSAAVRRAALAGWAAHP